MPDTPGAPPRKLRVLLADDHGIIREGLKALIDAQPDMEVAGEAADGEEACRRARDCSADVVVMDLSMPKMGGTQATAQIKERCPGTKVLALSMHEDAAYLRALLEAGASGYVLKRSAPQDLVRAVRAVAAGGTYLDPALAGKLVGGLLGGRPRQPAGLRGETQGQALSEREEAVLRLIALGHTSREVAERLSVSAKSVETYKARAMEKLGIEGRADIVRHAVRHGWLGEL